MQKNEQPIHSAKLVAASAEIKAILVKNDIAGVVVLHEEGYIENLVHLSTSYSIAQMEGSKFRALAPIEDTSNPQAAKKKIAGTVNMLANIAFKLQHLFMALGAAEDAVRKKFNITPPPRPGNNGNGRIIPLK